jgi:hypothetical protein
VTTDIPGFSSTGEKNAPDSSEFPDPELEILQDLLFSRYRQRIAELETELETLEERITNKDAFVATVSPILGDAIRRKIRDARGEMIEALYPVIGETVVRAVSEAIRDLTRNVDATMRTGLNPKNVARRVQGRVRGVSTGEMILRDSLPFQVAEIFLIHRETGLLLWEASGNPQEAADTDLISAMLTAIRDFVAESFGRGRDGQLDEIQYGHRRILIEAARYSYLAVVVDGIEPAGFRAKMRERIIEIDLAHEHILRDYQGDASQLTTINEPINSLVTATDSEQISVFQRRLIFAFMAMLLVCTVGACFTGQWGWQLITERPTPIVVVVYATEEPTFTPTATPTVTHTPTATSTPSPTATPTLTVTPTPTPVQGVMIGNVWLRQQPAADAPRMGLIMPEGRAVEILAVADEWVQVRWVPQDTAEVIGWAPKAWVGTANPTPERTGTATVAP